MKKLSIELLLKECGYNSDMKAAQDLGVTRMTIYKWKNNKCKPSIEHLKTMMIKSKKSKYKTHIKILKSMGY